MSEPGRPVPPYRLAFDTARDPYTARNALGIQVFSSSMQGEVPPSGGGTTKFLRADGIWAVPAAVPLPTQQIFTAGSGTYTSPPGCRRIEVTLVGGGAGGGGGNAGGAGTSGSNTTFGIATAGGAGANSTYCTSGAPGAASGGTQNISGGNGTDGNQSSGMVSHGGTGGVTIFGGAGGGTGWTGSALRNATHAAANSGAGGGGGPCNLSGQISGAGGSSGAAVIWFINSPAATYAYSVGAGGSGGIGGSGAGVGGNGAAGIIIVKEFY